MDLWVFHGVILCWYFSGKGRCGKNALSWLVGYVRISRSSWARLNNTFKSSWGRNGQCSVVNVAMRLPGLCLGPWANGICQKNHLEVFGIQKFRFRIWSPAVTWPDRGQQQKRWDLQNLRKILTVWLIDVNSECLGMWNNTFETWNSVPLSGLLLIFCTERAQTFRPHLIFLKPCYPKI